MSLTISIDVPDLTEESAHAIARAAELDGAPFTAAWNGGGMLNRRSGRWHVVMRDLDSDPSVASETLDHPEGWPVDPNVRAWLARAFSFLTEHAAEHRFSFHAGWPEHAVHKRLAVSLGSLLELIDLGRLRADLSYDVG